MERRTHGSEQMSVPLTDIWSIPESKLLFLHFIRNNFSFAVVDANLKEWIIIHLKFLQIDRINQSSVVQLLNFSLYLKNLNVYWILHLKGAENLHKKEVKPFPCRTEIMHLLLSSVCWNTVSVQTRLSSQFFAGRSFYPLNSIILTSKCNYIL